MFEDKPTKEPNFQSDCLTDANRLGAILRDQYNMQQSPMLDEEGSLGYSMPPPNHTNVSLQELGVQKFFY